MKVLTCSLSGRSVQLGKRVASSGEGTVWQTNISGYLAKLYHTPDPERVQKLQVMVAHPPQDPMQHHNHISFAWPQDLLKDGQGNCVGFLMPEVRSSEKLSSIYNPRLRNRKAPKFNWYYLHTTALNIASVVQAIHQKNYVVGDIKPQNILVNNQALVSVIDTDSFQIRDPETGKVFRCLVGSEGFTPAELLGKELSALDQTELHDRFRLGVIIYLLLFGDHPFKGKWIGPGESPQPTDLIQQGFWPFAPNSLIQPGPNTIPLEIIHSKLQSCFQRCFTAGHQNSQARPAAREWCEALTAAIADLKTCHQETNHCFSRNYGRCYWCDRKAVLKVDIFNPRTKVAPVPARPKAPVTALNQDYRTAGTLTLAQPARLATRRPQSNLLLKYAQFLLRSWAKSPSLVGATLCLLSATCLGLLFIPDLAQIVSSDLDREAWRSLTSKFTSAASSSFSPDNSSLIKPASSQVELAALPSKNGHLDWVTSVAISPDGKTLASSSRDMTLKLWNLQTGALIKNLNGHFDPIQFATLLPNGTSLISGSDDGHIILWDLQSGSQRSLMGDPYLSAPTILETIAVSANGKVLASSSTDTGSTIVLQDIPTGNLIKEISGYSLAQTIALSPNGQLLVSSNMNSPMKVWNLNTGRLILNLPDEPDWMSLSDSSVQAHALAISPDNQTLASGGWRGLITLWNLKTGQRIRSFTGHAELVNTLTISPDGKMLVSGSHDRLVRVWNLQTGELLHTLSGHQGMILSLDIGPDNQTLVSGSEDHTIKIWHLKTGKLIRTLAGG